MKAKIKLEIKGKVVELELDEAKELAQVLADMTGVRLKEVERIIERHHDHYHDRWWYAYPVTWWNTYADQTTTTYTSDPLAIGDNITVGYIS